MVHISRLTRMMYVKARNQYKLTLDLDNMLPSYFHLILCIFLYYL